MAGTLPDQDRSPVRQNPMDGDSKMRPLRERGQPEGAAGRGLVPVHNLPWIPSTRKTRGSEQGR